MNDKFPYLRRIAPQEFADFLNAKGSNAGAFKCPVCGEEHQTLVDNMPITNQKSDHSVVLQPALPAFMYPNSIFLQEAIEKEGYSDTYKQFTGVGVAVVNQILYREVVHLICDNCGYVRSFSKDKVLQWLIDEGKYDAK